MNKKLLEDATLRLLETLGELTLDTNINDAIVAMNVACVRIRRLEDWIEVVEGEEPEGKVLISYDQERFGCFSPETECAYFEDGIWRFWLSDREVHTRENGVTHWQPLPERGKL